MEAVVIMPDYLHCISTLPKGDDERSTLWRRIKLSVRLQVPASEAEAEIIDAVAEAIMRLLRK
jgi:REP element-mobilizing transposase RayT